MSGNDVYVVHVIGHVYMGDDRVTISYAVCMVYGDIVIENAVFTWDVAFEAEPVEEDVPGCLFLLCGVSCDKVYVCDEGVCSEEVSDHMDG